MMRRLLRHLLFRRAEPRPAAIAKTTMHVCAANEFGISTTGSGPINPDRFYSWHFEPGTMTIDPMLAAREEILAAMLDCRQCSAIEYPETEQGYERARKRYDELEAAFAARWPDEAAANRAEMMRKGMRASVAAHGGSLPEWAR